MLPGIVEPPSSPELVPAGVAAGYLPSKVASDASAAVWLAELAQVRDSD